MSRIYPVSFLLRRLIYVCLMASPMIHLSSCQPDDEHFRMPEEMQYRIFERLETDPDFSTFVKGIELAGLKEILQRSGLYTTFAPTNAAFDAYLQANGYASIESIPDTVLVPLINYHFMVPMKFSFDFKEPARLNTRANKHLSVSGEGGTFTVNGIPVLPEKVNMEAMNGAIHGIPEVLVVPPTLDEAISKRTDLKTYAKLLKTFTLRRFDAQASTDTNGDGTIDSVFVEESLITGFWWRDQTALLTAFAPTDEAFATFLAENGYASLEEVPKYVLEIILKYHFVEGAKKLADLGEATETIGEEILLLSNSAVVTADIALNNGFLHVTQKVLFPPSLGTLTGLIYLDKDKDLSKFAQAVQKAAMSAELASATQEFTVFAPTNDAFAASGINVETETADVLAKIVRYHILRSKIMSGNLTGTHATHLGADKQITIVGTAISGAVNTATIIETDIVATNGVLHKIDAVLKPE